MTEKNTNSNGHKQLSTKWVHPDLYEYIVNSMKREGLSQTAVVSRAIKMDKDWTEGLLSLKKNLKKETE